MRCDIDIRTLQGFRHDVHDSQRRSLVQTTTNFSMLPRATASRGFRWLNEPTGKANFDQPARENHNSYSPHLVPRPRPAVHSGTHPRVEVSPKGALSAHLFRPVQNTARYVSSKGRRKRQGVVAVARHASGHPCPTTLAHLAHRKGTYIMYPFPSRMPFGVIGRHAGAASLSSPSAWLCNTRFAKQIRQRCSYASRYAPYRATPQCNSLVNHTHISPIAPWKRAHDSSNTLDRSMPYRTMGVNPGVLSQPAKSMTNILATRHVHCH